MSSYSCLLAWNNAALHGPRVVRQIGLALRIIGGWAGASARALAAFMRKPDLIMKIFGTLAWYGSSALGVNEI